jgi:hypothetical protein
MNGRYIKQGRSVRLEVTRAGRSRLEVSEHGEATEDGRTFVARSAAPASGVRKPAASVLASIETQLLAALPPTVSIERMTAVTGTAKHRFAPSGLPEREWSESHIRLHASLVHRERAARVLVDLGGARWTEQHSAWLARVAAALGQLDGGGPLRSWKVLRLGSSIAAALWPELLVALLEHPGAGSRLALSQRRHDVFRLDGFGDPIAEVPLSGAGVVSPAHWPNFFRPTYRVRPVRAAFHLGATLPPSNERPDADAVALLAPIRVHRSVVNLELLATDRNVSFALPVVIGVERLASSLFAGAQKEMWFPYAAGSWGGAVLLAP